MAISTTKKLVWLVRTIHRAGKIPFKDIQQKWAENEDLSGGQLLPRKTFNNWIFAVWDTFGLSIECDRCGDYPYYIANEEDLHNGAIESWLISTYSVSNSLEASRCIKDKIFLEAVPSGLNYLDDIIDALADSRMIHISYHKYGDNQPREHYVMPLCVKLFRQRWYFVGRVWANGVTLVYSLDRITGFRLSSHTFDYPEDFQPEDFFSGCFGVVADNDVPVERVVIRSTAFQAHYLRDLPLVENQTETERAEEYSLFEMRVRPTYDFIQQLLWNGENLEVVSPQWLREEMLRRTEEIASRYR